MKARTLLFITANFLAVVVLAALFAGPFYFAKNFTKVAGIKTVTPYIITFQGENFPNLHFTESGGKYRITFSKIGPSQAFLKVLLLENPSNQGRLFTLQVFSGDAKVFFGDKIDDQKTKVYLKPQSTTPISLLSQTQNQTVEFGVNSD